MDDNVPALTPEQLRYLITSYLEEVSYYYEEQERRVLEGANSKPDRRLENRVSELLTAMGLAKDPDERRQAVLQVLSRAMERREPNLPS